MCFGRSASLASRVREDVLELLAGLLAGLFSAGDGVDRFAVAVELDDVVAEHRVAGRCGAGGAAGEGKCDRQKTGGHETAVRISFREGVGLGDGGNVRGTGDGSTIWVICATNCGEKCFGGVFAR